MKRFACLLVVAWLLFTATTAIAGSNIILLSGGPCIYDPLDPERHDQSWANYVTPPGLMHNAKTLVAQPGQEVWWFVYKPAYTARWEDDLKATDFRKDATKEVKEMGYESYVDLIEKKAESRGWKLKWIDSASDFWSKMETFKDPIDKFFYWGHARDDLWLTCEHNAQHRAIAPDPSAIVNASDIPKHDSLKENFTKGKKESSEFWGCNTASFAKRWKETMTVKSIGFEGSITFVDILKTNGIPALGSDGIRKEY